MQTAVEDGKVAKVEVHQNAQVPTGYLNVHMTDGSVDGVNVSDVNEAVNIWMSRESTVISMMCPREYLLNIMYSPCC